MVLEVTEHCRKLDLRVRVRCNAHRYGDAASPENNITVLEVPLDGPADVFCDNNSVVQSSTFPASVLKKKHNAVSFHKVRETIAAGVMCVSHEGTDSNLVDLLSKQLAGPRHHLLSSHILH